MKATAITDIGKTRAVNQDYIYTSVDRVGCLPNLFIVADGMGGHKAGDTASRFTVETIKTLIEQSQGKDAISIINDSVKMVNGLLYRRHLNQRITMVWEQRLLSQPYLIMY